MTSVVFKDENGTTFRPDGFPREESGEQVFMQSVVPVDPETGTPIDIATEATLLALNTAIGTLNAAADAVKTAVEAMNAKTTAINTDDIAGVVELGAGSLAAFENVQATIANFPANQPVSATALPLPSGAATEATLDEMNTAVGAPADAAATTDAGSFSLIAFFKRLLSKIPVLGAALAANSLPVVIASDQAAIKVAGYDSGDDMIKVKSVQKKWRDSFVGSSLNVNKWDSTLGTGGAITVGGNTLTLGSGTTINAETSVLSKENFTIPFRVNIGLTLSQRIANQTFLVEAVSVDSGTGVPDGLHCVALLFDGTTATQAKYRVQNSGATPLDSAANTFPTTASGGFYELEPFADEAWFHGGTLDSTNGRANSYRRHQQIPEPNAVFKIRLRWLNGGSAPASNTNAVIQYITVQDYAELTAEITAGRGQTVAGQAVGVAVVNTPSVTISGNPVMGAGTNLIGFTPVPLPTSVADIASAALTTTTTTAAITPGWGTAYEVNIPVTAVSGTNPTLDVVVQESDDAGTNYFDVYHFPRITATGIYRSPKIKLTGNRIRYVQTVSGTTPSFTRSLNRLQSTETVEQIRQLIDRTISLTTQNAVTAGLLTRNCKNAQVVLNLGVATTPPAVQLEGSEDNGATYYAIGAPLTGVASSTVQLTVNNIHASLLRARISTAGVTVTAGYLLIKGF